MRPTSVPEEEEEEEEWIDPVWKPGIGDDGGELNMVQKLYVFYKCPIGKP